jgi:hypothetical protein
LKVNIDIANKPKQAIEIAIMENTPRILAVLASEAYSSFS